MENFVVSARKYRPLGFDEVVGQSHITTTLKNAIENNHLAQALLFCGPRGVGKTTCARILARMVNGMEETDNVDSANALNIYELDAASNNSVDDIRNLIDQVRYPPQQGNFKVYIIDEVHMLSNQAFNAFLKTLEEPPSYAIFILATTEKHKVIPTILSRCQIFDFNRIEISDITWQLKQIAEKENIEAEEEALHLISQKADGALRDALSIFDLIVTFSSGNKVTYQDAIKNLHILDYDYFFKVTDLLNSENLPESLLLFNEILKEGFDGHNFIVGLAEHLRNVMVCKDPQTVKLLEVSENVQKKYIEQSNNISLSFILSSLNILNICDLNYKASKNQRLHVELALMKIAYLNEAFNLNQIAPTELKKKSPELEKKESPTASAPAVEAKLISPTAVRPTVSSNRKAETPKLTDIHKKVDSSEKQEELIPDEDKRKNKFGIEEVQSALLKYCSDNNLSNTYLSLLKNEIKLPKEFEIEIQLKNSVEKKFLGEIEVALTKYMRDALENDFTMISSAFNQETTVRTAYTNAEIFEEMLEKKPELLKLKEALGLDTEF